MSDQENEAGRWPESSAAARRLLNSVEKIAAFRREIKPELESALNDYLSTESPESAVEKKWVATLVNDVLSGCGFAISNNGEKCSLYALAGSKDPKGRFRLQPSSGKSPSAYSAQLSGLLPLNLSDIHAGLQAFSLSRPPDDSLDPTWGNYVKGREPRNHTP